MGLTNGQFQKILREYENLQLERRHILSDRKETLYRQVPAYAEIDKQIASVSVEQGKKLLNGDSDALHELHDRLEILKGEKEALLLANHFPLDYLDPPYQCKDCKDTGYIVSKKCHCLKQKIISVLYRQSGIQSSLREHNFSTLSFQYYKGDDLKRFEQTVLSCKKFVKNFNSDYHNLFFYGTVGTGKSFLSECIADELIQNGYSVLYFSSASLFDLLAAQTFYHKEDATSLEDLYDCDLLIVDDLGTELTNQFVSSSFFAFINERHLAKKATIISTNLSLEELRDRYSDRVFSRITSHYDLFKLTGPDIRMMKKRLAGANPKES